MSRLLFSGEGRLDRLGYLAAMLVAAVLFCAPALAVVSRPADGAARMAVLAAGTVCWLAVLWIYCAATAKRLHDLGRSGWLTLLALIPAVGLGAMTVVLLTLRGDAAANRYGERWL